MLCHFTWSSEPHKGLAIWRAKVVPSVLNSQLFLIPGYWSVDLRIKPVNSPPAVKRSKNYRTFLNNSRPSINHLPQVLKKIASFVSIFTLFFSISRRAITLHMLSMKCMQEWLNKLRLPSTIWSWCLKRLLSWCSPHSVIPTVKCTSTNFRIYLHCWP